MLICTRQEPVGWKERINFTLERRSNCHLRICGGISIFLPLSPGWSVKGRVFSLISWLWAVVVTDQSITHLPKKTQNIQKNKNSGGQTGISHSAHTATSKDKSAVFHSPCSVHPAALQRSITCGSRVFDQLIDIFSLTSSSSVGHYVDIRC